MSKSKILSERLREVLLNGRWIANTNYSDQIQNLDWKQAYKKVENLNTIALLVFHINYYMSGILNAFETSRLEISDKYSFDMSPISSQDSWQNLVSEFIHNAEKFTARIVQMTDDELEKPFVDGKYGTVQHNIDGFIEHSYYHLGQISLLKKLTNESS